MLVKGKELSTIMAKDYSTRIKGGIKYFNDYLVSDIQLKQLHNFREHRISNESVSGNTVRHDFIKRESDYGSFVCHSKTF
jgi:hypothetical protein